MFKPRLEAPSYTDPNWIVQSDGGKNPCIRIVGNSVLPNCFSGDTKIVTREGVRRLDSILGQDIEVLSFGGEYRKAHGYCFGYQRLYKITFTNGDSFRCTANHEWLVYVDGAYIRKQTKDLTMYDIIPYVGGKDMYGDYSTSMISLEDIDCIEKVYCIVEPETHTMVLSDGILTGQCTGYAVGRSLELYGNDAYSLPWQENAGQYYPKLKESSVWKRSSTPKLGSIVCWSRAGQAGHVAVVEQINADNSIVTSESAWQSTRFYTQTLYPPAYTWNPVYVLQGFIYNTKGPTSSSSKIEELIKNAKSVVGKRAKSVITGSTTPTSTELILYCAKSVLDVVGTVMPNKTTPSSFVSVGVAKGMGSYISGPLHGRVITPKPGDIVMLRISKTRTYNKDTDCDALCLIVEVNNSYIKTVHINVGGIISLQNIKDSSKTICGYYRPKWSLLDNSTETMVGYAPLGKFYDTESTSEDATIREVAYIDNNNKPSINKSSVKLSVINYTTLLSSVMDGLLVPSIYSGNIGSDVIVDGIQNAKAKECIQFFISKNLNAAAACGICGNIEAESVPPYNTASVGDYGTSFGICQWHYGRGTSMKQFVGAGWENNLTGQLEYLWYELQNAYKNSVLLPIMNVSNNEQGARIAADIFVRKFEVPAEVDKQSQIRQKNASDLYNQLLVQMTTTSNNTSSVIPSNKAFSGKTIEIPNYIHQAGIDTTYTNYAYWYRQWGNSTYQRRVATLWNNKGRKHNRHIATIDGMYLIALKTTFGISGDKVSVILNDGTVINCIIADSKGWENDNIYGHNSSSGGINVIEWEAMDSTEYSPYVKIPPDISGWKGKNVKKIINGGSIL
jgi:surface antigen